MPLSNKRLARKRIHQNLEIAHFASCEHPVSPALEQLFSSPSNSSPALRSSTACPECITYRIICTLSAARAKLISRGGDLLSKDIADHHPILCCWHAASLHGFQVYDLLEKFVKMDVTDEDREAAYVAMSCWVTYRSKTRVPPGMEDRYPDGIDREEEKVDIPTLGEHAAVVDALIQEAERKGSTREDILQQPLCGPKLVPVSAESTQEDVVKAVQLDNASSAIEDHPLPRIDAAVRTHKSNLKRGRGADSHSTTPKRVRLEDHATISSTYSSIVSYPFKTAQCPEDIAQRFGIPVINRETTTEPHSCCASATTRRPKHKMKANGPGYARGKWASPAGFKKQDTSWATRTDELQYELSMLAEESNWRVQWQEEERLGRVFKEMGARWYEMNASRCKNKLIRSKRPGVESC